MTGLSEISPGHELENLRNALGRVSDFSLAIDCGAHQGIWTRMMLTKFDRVWAFEPKWSNFVKLPEGSHNVPMAVGLDGGKYSLETGPENTGQWHVRPGNEIAMCALDWWDWPSCGFLKVDVEGWEAKALLGAQRLIERHGPVVLIEENGLCEKYYKTPKGTAGALLEMWGYKLAAICNKDFIYVRV